MPSTERTTSLSQRLHRLTLGSLTGRMVSVVLGLLLIVQLASYAALHTALADHARDELPAQLQRAERLLQTLLLQRSHAVTDAARLLAGDVRFADALASGVDTQVSAVLAAHARRLGASAIAWLGPQLQVRAAVGSPAPTLQPVIDRLTTSAARGGPAHEIALVGPLLQQLVLVPTGGPLGSGWVLIGFPLDQRLVREVQTLAPADVTLLARTEAGWRPAVSSLAPAQADGLARAWPLPTGRDAVQTLAIGDDALGLRSLALTEDTPGHPRVVALVSASIAAATALPRHLQLALMLTTLLGFAVFAAGSVFTARRMAVPLRSLARAAERLSAGDYETPVQTRRRSDEIGRLAEAFERMRVGVGEKQAEVLRLAYWDGLTGLPNRTQFRDAVQAAIAAAPPGATVSVIMLDLDRFKHVNDVLGYRYGDLVLSRVAERLTQQSVRGGDVVARLGGDEFAVLLGQGDASVAQTVAQRIERAFDQPLQLEEHTVDMGAGIGIACWPMHASDPDLLLSRAEVAMYAAKRRGSGAVMYDPSIDAASAQTLSLLGELRQAIGQDQLRLWVQPKLSLADGAVVGAEALLRWQHPTRGMVPPMHFIPFAEQTGFIRTLTLWVVDEAARQWRRLRSEGVELVLSVNLSTRDLLDPELPQKFAARLQRHEVPPTALCLEITESAIMDDPQRALATLERLSALGFQLAIDDFGTGYSSLAYLKRLPVDELKIDKSFVLSMARDADDAKIVRSTIDLAHNLGLRVVAEGVENAQAWDLLRDLRCDQAQGFHMGRPMPVHDFAAWAASWQTRRREARRGDALLH